MEDLKSYTAFNKKRVETMASLSKSLIQRYSAYSDVELQEMTQKFRHALQDGVKLESVAPHALAVCSEAIRRRLGIVPYDVQLIAASAMTDNIIAEMQTGEGKTIVQILSSYLHILEATKSPNKEDWKNVHILTANEYLAQRDKEQNEKVFDLLGISCGYVEERKGDNSEEFKAKKKDAYQKDIVYATAKTVAFDYLEDNRAYKKEDIIMQKKPYKAVVDEADDILLDQATTPLILTGSLEYMRANDERTVYDWATRFLNGTIRKKGPVTIKIFDQYDKDKHTPFMEEIALFKDRSEVVFSERFAKELEEGLDTDEEKSQEILFQKYQSITNAVIAKYLFLNGRDYILTEGENGKKDISLISASTGRLMPKTKYEFGIQEAIEAKEMFNTKGQINRKKPNVTLSKCTYPAYMRIYENGVCGMTGTSDIEEFKAIYNLETYKVPTNKPNQRQDDEPELYSSKETKYRAIAKEVLKAHSKGQPVLLGTINVNESDEICEYLDKLNIPYQRLDAVNHKDEAQKITKAGNLGMVTVATNMAGRGTDIKVSPDSLIVGGLYVIGTSRNKNERIDRQLIGRTARQGNIGKSKYYMSLDDEMIRMRYGSVRFAFYKEFYKDEYGPIKNKKVINLVENCQKKEEDLTKQSRIKSEEIDEKTFTKQMNIIYNLRNQILNASDKELVMILINTIKRYVKDTIDHNEEYKLNTIIDINTYPSENKEMYKENMINKVGQMFKESKGTMSVKNYMETIRNKFLMTIDAYWITQMMKLEELKKSILYTSSFEENPMDHYEIEANKLFIEMNESIKNEMIYYATNPKTVFGTYKVPQKEEQNDRTIQISR